jgi:hypothetical protein
MRCKKYIWNSLEWIVTIKERLGKHPTDFGKTLYNERTEKVVHGLS